MDKQIVVKGIAPFSQFNNQFLVVDIYTSFKKSGQGAVIKIIVVISVMCHN